MAESTPHRLAQLVDRHAASLTLYARQWCDCPADVVQETFVKLATIEPWPDPVEPWLFRVTRNAALSASRQAQRRVRREQAVAGTEAWFDAAEARLDAQLATQALAALPAELREVIVARIWGGLTFAQVAVLCEASPATVYRRYQAGLEQLRARLGESCPTTNGPKPS